VDLSYGTSGIGGALNISYPQARETSTLSYDARDRLTGVDITGQDGVLRASRHSVYGMDGVIRQRQTASPLLAQTLSDVFQVDFMGAVVAENFDVVGVPLLTGNVDNTTVAPYMAVGKNWRVYTTNRLSNITNLTTATTSTTRTYNLANQLTTDGAAAAIQYDAADNLSKYGAASAAVTTFDLERHPVSVDGTGGNIVTAVYDALGRRIVENQSGAATFLVWDGQQLVGHTNPDASLSLDVPGSGIDEHLAYDLPLSEVTITSGREIYLHQDTDGSVFAATNSSGLLAAYTYTAFGEPHEYSKLGTTVSNRFLFQGALFDPWTASYSMRAREYMPSLARFASVDPIGLLGGTPNLYGFVYGNPLSFADPLGLRPAVHKTPLWQFTFGVVMGYLQGSIPGAFLLQQPPISKRYLQGAAVGLGLAGAVDGGTALLGGGEGTALCSTGVGCLAGAPALAGSVALGINALGDGARAVSTWDDSNNMMSSNDSDGSGESSSRDEETGGAPAAQTNPTLGQEIADGHAWDKHVVNQNEFSGVNSKSDFASLIDNTVANGEMKNLARGRTAYYDGSTNTLVIHDPSSPDSGTAFRPRDGRSYFDGLR
jgi:filamentous hemagglutinin